MTLKNKNKLASFGFHTIRISHDAFIAVKNKNLEEYKKGLDNNVGETASNMILAGA